MPVLTKRNQEKATSKKVRKKMKPATDKNLQALTDNNVKDNTLLSIFTSHTVTDQLMELICKSIDDTLKNMESFEVKPKELLTKWKIHIPQESDFLKTILGTSIKLQPIKITSAHKFIISHEHICLYLTIPLETFLDNDRYNHRYFVKQLLYTLYIVSNISMFIEETIILDNCQYQFKAYISDINDSSFLLDPHIIVKLFKLNQNMQGKEFKFITQITIKLIPSGTNKTEHSKSLKLSKFYPNKCNLKVPLPTESLPKSTPHYNSQIANDLLTLSNVEFINSTLNVSPIEFAETVQENINLIHQWAKQRGLLAVPNLAFILKYFVTWMVKNQKLAIGQNAFQMFKSTLSQIKNSDWTRDGLYFATTTTEESNIEEILKLFHKHFDVVFLDCTNNYNICWHIYKADYLWVKYEAELTLKHLETTTDPADPSHWLFNSVRSFALSFDHVFKFSVPLLPYRNHLTINDKIDQTIVAEDGGFVRAVKSSVLKILQRGLKDHVKLIVARPGPAREIPLNDLLSNVENRKGHVPEQMLSFEFGLILDESKLNCSLIRGPPLDSAPQAEKEFIEFWGANLCLIRKFMDGVSARAVIFQPDHGCEAGFEERRTPYRIVSHLLQRHCGLDAFKPLNRYLCYDEKSCLERMALGVQFVTDASTDDNVETRQPYNFTGNKELTSGQKLSLTYGTGESALLPHVQARDQLCKILREDLKDLPLEIESVTGGLDSIYRQTEAFPPLCWEHFSKEHRPPADDQRQDPIEGHNRKRPYPNGDNKKTPSYIPYTTLLLWPERNSKWPQALNATPACDTNTGGGRKGEALNGEMAVEKVKTALLISIRHALKDVVQRCSLCKKRTQKSSVILYLQVFYRGFCFHLYLAGPPTSQTSPKSLTLSDDECQTSLEISQALLALHPKFPCYSLTCRLIKRWLACHMLLSAPNYESVDYEDRNDSLFPELWVDIVVAYIFLSPQPYGPPINSPSLGLARFLHLVTSHDWKLKPLCLPLLPVENVDTSKSISKTTVHLQKSPSALFQNIGASRRSEYPYMTVLCTTIAGTDGSRLSESANKLVRNLSPGPPACRRLLMLSRASERELRDCSSLEPWKCDESAIKWDNLYNLYREIFTTPLQDYDVLITLVKSRNARSFQSFQKPSKLYVPTPGIFGAKKEISGLNSRSTPITGFDPANDYLHLLRSTFGHVALFFHDLYGGHVIGVLWKPSSTFAHQIRKYCYKRPIGDLKIPDLTVDYASIIEDFKILGQDLVLNVECRTERWNRID